MSPWAVPDRMGLPRIMALTVAVLPRRRAVAGATQAEAVPAMRAEADSLAVEAAVVVAIAAEEVEAAVQAVGAGEATTKPCLGLSWERPIAECAHPSPSSRPGGRR